MTQVRRLTILDPLSGGAATLPSPRLTGGHWQGELLRLIGWHGFFTLTMGGVSESCRGL